MDKRLARAKATREINSVKKEAEQDRRDAHMVELIKAGEFPYTPGVMSWVSLKLDKKASQLKPEDVQGLVS